MLTETSYHYAIYAYTGAAGVMLLYLLWWLPKHFRAGWVCLLVLLAAAFLLTPAYQSPGASTLAPAVIVAGFQLLTDGYEAAQQPLTLLGMACGAAVALSLLLWLLVFRPWARRARRANEKRAATSGGAVAPATGGEGRA